MTTMTKAEFKRRFLNHIKDKGVTSECFRQYEATVDDAWKMYTDHRDCLSGCVPEEWADANWGIEIKTNGKLIQSVEI